MSGVQESFRSPFLDVVNATTDVIVDDSVSNNNGVIDPGEAVKLAVTLTNPWRGARRRRTSVSAVLSTTTPGVTIYGDSATYPGYLRAIDRRGIIVRRRVDPAVPCGTAIDFTITTTSSLGTTDATFRVRVGGANGTDPPITYTDTIAGGLAIPDASSRGVFHQLSITDDFEIADVNYRIDNRHAHFRGRPQPHAPLAQRRGRRHDRPHRIGHGRRTRRQPDQYCRGRQYRLRHRRPT